MPKFKKMENERLQNYYKDLPPHYREDYCIDAKKPSVGVIFNIVALLIMAVVGVLAYLARFGLHPIYEDGLNVSALIAILIILLGYFVYIVLHELTHGICYKLLTKQKLTFGLTLTVAYCGLKEGYVNKKTALISVLAPFVVHSIWMLLCIFFIRDPLIAFSFVVLFALHFGGCVGDLWVTSVLALKYRGKQTLMCDNGPKQQFFIYDENAPEYPQTEVTPSANVSLFGAEYSPEETSDGDNNQS